MDGIILFLTFSICLGLYFLPALVAEARKHPQKASITCLNLFLGWTLLGWVIAIVWAFGNSNTTNNISNEYSATKQIEALAALKEKGIITEEEFNKKKAQLLGL